MTKPNISKVQRVAGQFQDSTVIYDSTTVTYDDVNTLYGGSDRVQPILSTIKDIDIQKPTASSIDLTRPNVQNIE